MKMKIRIKNKKDDLKSNFVYEIDDEKGTKTEISIAYLETAIKIMKLASEKAFIKNEIAFEKFLINLQRATKYHDKVNLKLTEEPSFLHIKQSALEIKEYKTKAVKYDKKAKAAFSLHNGWYNNFIEIIDEIKEILEETYENLTEEKEMLYTATRIDSVLDKYRRNQKQKVL